MIDEWTLTVICPPLINTHTHTIFQNIPDEGGHLSYAKGGVGWGWGHIHTGLVTTTRAGLIGPGTHVVGVVVCPPQCPIWDNYSATMTTKFNVRCDGHNGSECDSSHKNSSSAQANTGQ